MDYYLQFDGVSDDVYRKTRNTPLFKEKLKAIDNWRRLGDGVVVLVVTLIKGVNDHQLGDIIKFASENNDVVKCVNVQPISFSGRATELDVKKGRITTYDFVRLVEEQTGGRVKAKHFYPVPSMVAVSRFVEASLREKMVAFTTHPCCGVGTFLFVGEDGNFTPINEIVDVDIFLKLLEEGGRNLGEGNLANKLSLGGLKNKAMLMAEVGKSIRDKRCRDLILGVLRKGTYKSTGDFTESALLVSCMHFMDAWNFDLERVGRCVVHYTLPDGRIIPFCSYNNLHREAVEKEFSVS